MARAKLDGDGAPRRVVAGPARGAGHEFLSGTGPGRLRIVAARPAPASARFDLEVHIGIRRQSFTEQLVAALVEQQDDHAVMVVGQQDRPEDR